ncbi:LytR C-terminal domain-containing protein [Bombiscardovia coagulans]|uniref:Cell wall integrity and stress response protein 1 n=1 Tax=Bombiscardovia coagulans TaxID=686666 RepID=A0A261ETD8_9BIFI|nr:LytR C-terminal domain-containing protein [Bombiscardovia coagulans]OZG50113.1 cell wall integrity and stress response protein 1 [Bombiscardovia coagulans]
MASNRNENGYQPYTPDEFDDPPEGPVGVHRGPRPIAVRMVPFIVVIVLAVLCGIGAWTVLSGSRLPWQHGQNIATHVQASKQATSEPKKTQNPPKEKPAAPAQPSSAPNTPAPSAPPTAAANKAAAVKVINGTSISRHAAGKRQQLVAAGYTNVTASNPSGQLPQTSVVWYQSEGDKATAEDVAKTLGISNVEQSANAGASVVAVLME